MGKIAFVCILKAIEVFGTDPHHHPDPLVTYQNVTDP